MEDRSDKIFEGLQAIKLEIACIEGAGDTGSGAGECEVFVTRGGIEYRVTISPYWDEEADEPIEQPEG
jgi:hypothetical protein